MSAIASSQVTYLNDVVDSRRGTQYTQISIHRDEKYQAQWLIMNPSPIPCFNETLVKELNEVYNRIHHGDMSPTENNIRFQIISSKVPGVFNLGGDLKMFKNLVVSRNEQALRKYAYACVDTMYSIATSHQVGCTQIALIQGDALGGGLETAISCDVVIAERQKRASRTFCSILFPE